MKNKFFRIVIYIIIIILLAIPNTKTENVENLGIAVGVGYTYEEKGGGNISYKIPFSTVIYEEEGENENTVRAGIANTITESRENRQLRDDKKFFLGAEKVYILDEKMTSFGIKNMIEILFKNPAINDTGFCVVCKGNSTEYLSMKIEDYKTPVEYLAGMIKNISGYNFFGKNYTLGDVFLQVDSEGRNLVLPYVEKTKDAFQITGMALFKKDKLVTVIGISDATNMSMLRENESKGVLTIQKNSKEYINYECKVKKKAKCIKEGDDYKFTIDLNIKGSIASNTLYNKLSSDMQIVKKFEEDMSKKVKSDANDFIEKMKNEYKVDCLELGRIAAAKYGRGTGVDWNEIVCNSKIEVNVNVKLDKIGRGEY